MYILFELLKMIILDHHCVAILLANLGTSLTIDVYFVFLY